MTDSHLIPTEQAAARLGIRVDSLYAYVSRGVIRSHKRDGHRGSWFAPNDLDALARRGRGPQPRPDVYFESAITLIEDGHYWYRGHDAVDLSASHSFEAVSGLLWNGTLEPTTTPWIGDASAVDASKRALATLPKTARTIECIRLAIAAAAPHDELRTDLRPNAVAETGARLIASTLDSLPGRHQGPLHRSIAERVWNIIHPREPTGEGIDALNMTLCLMADHELPASTSAARIAASFRANPYHVVAAGLGALSGALHGGASRDVGRFLAEAEAVGASVAAGTWLGEGRDIPGLGHPLYPNGDPRAVAIFERVQAVAPSHLAVAAAYEVSELAAQRGLPAPNVDFALSVMTRALGFEGGGAEAIMAIARISGWIAHAMEEYSSRSAIRMRAVYSGPRPQDRRTSRRKNSTCRE